MNIRKAAFRDIPQIEQLLVQVNMVHHHGRPDLFRAGCQKYNQQQLKEILQDEKNPVFVATDANDQTIGYAFCKLQQHSGDSILQDIKTFYIDDLCVDENHRGEHVGAALYQYVVDFAKKIGCYNLTLNVWSCNPSAIRFYEKCGLKPQKIGMEKIL